MPFSSSRRLGFLRNCWICGCHIVFSINGLDQKRSVDAACWLCKWYFQSIILPPSLRNVGVGFGRARDGWSGPQAILFIRCIVFLQWAGGISWCPPDPPDLFLFAHLCFAQWPNCLVSNCRTFFQRSRLGMKQILASEDGDVTGDSNSSSGPIHRSSGSLPAKQHIGDASCGRSQIVGCPMAV